MLLLKNEESPCQNMRELLYYSRYSAALGDIVIGRVTEVCSPISAAQSSRSELVRCVVAATAPACSMPCCAVDSAAMRSDGGLAVQVAGKRWRLDIGARQEVSLQLSSVDLPGGAQVGTCLGKGSALLSTNCNLHTCLESALALKSAKVHAGCIRLLCIQRAVS